MINNDIDKILREAMKCDKKIDDNVVLNLKSKLASQNMISQKKGISIWWLPAFSGTIITIAFLAIILFYIPNSAITSILFITSVISILFSWCFTIIGIKKFELIKEACIL